jgi:hypothetical protein
MGRRLTMAECGSALTEYTPVGTVKFVCTQAAGHKGAHFDAAGPMSWTCSVAVIPPHDLTRPG